MKPSKSFLRAGGLLTLSLVTAGSAHAADYLASVGHWLQNPVTLATGDRILVDLQQNHSYSCEAIPVASDTNFDFSASVVGTATTNPDTPQVRFTGKVTPLITGEAGTDSQDNRVSFTAGTSDRYRIDVANTKTGGEPVEVRCLETTLFGGYNTNVNDFNFLEISNLSNATVTGKIYATNFDGTQVINGVAYTVAAGKRTDVDVHTAAGADKFGTIYITTDAPYGAVQAYVSQYAGTVTNFTLSASIKLEPIAQLP